MEFGTATTELQYCSTTRAQTLLGLFAGRGGQRGSGKVLLIMVSKTTVDGA